MADEAIVQSVKAALQKSMLFLSLESNTDEAAASHQERIEMVEVIKKAVGTLFHLERDILTKRYLLPKSMGTTDADIWQELWISKQKYYRFKKRAMLNLSEKIVSVLNKEMRGSVCSSCPGTRWGGQETCLVMNADIRTLLVCPEWEKRKEEVQRQRMREAETALARYWETVEQIDRDPDGSKPNEQDVLQSLDLVYATITDEKERAVFLSVRDRKPLSETARVMGVPVSNLHFTKARLLKKVAGVL